MAELNCRGGQAELVHVHRSRPSNFRQSQLPTRPRFFTPIYTLSNSTFSGPVMKLCGNIHPSIRLPSSECGRRGRG